MVAVSPTGSGKSLVFYLLFRYFNSKTIFIVPTIGLVNQMSEDFHSYGYGEEIHGVTAGVEKDTDALLTITTYQSVVRQPMSWFAQFVVSMTDEAHVDKTKSLRTIFDKMPSIGIRIGMTGTLSEHVLDKMKVIGILGPSIQFTTTKKLIDKGYLSEIFVNSLILVHEGNVHWNLSDRTYSFEYPDEIEFLMNSHKRLDFIRRLSISLKGNTLVMFKRIDYGEKLFQVIKESTDKLIFYVDGKTEIENREETRKSINESENSLTICSTVFSTGININRLNNIILAQPVKSKIPILQTIGRGTRLHENKNGCAIYDIGDKIYSDFDNITYRHSQERLRIYKSEKFPIKENRIVLK